jgi:cytochrome c biogenesis protein CcmG, thiol:disulfide interchange protein DsbE
MNKQRALLFIPLIIFGILSLFFLRGLSLDPNEMPSALLNKSVPAFSLPVLPAEENPAGLEFATAELLKGRVSLLNVWATWCVTCRQEHEFLNSLKAQGVIIYGINYKDARSEALQWLSELHNPYVFSVEDEQGRLGLDLGVFGAPETYVLDKNGVIRYKHIGDVNKLVWEQTLKPIMDSL